MRLWRQTAALSRGLSGIPYQSALGRSTRFSSELNRSANKQIPQLSRILSIRCFSATVSRLDANVEITQFAQLAEEQLVDESIIKSITSDMKLETMTPVQSATIRSALQGSDVYVSPDHDIVVSMN